jgi:hypothetical protein
MPRLAGVTDNQSGPLTRFAFWMARRKIGKVPDPMRVSAHHRAISMASGGYEYWLDRAKLVDARLKVLAAIKAATMVGCPF